MSELQHETPRPYLRLMQLSDLDDFLNIFVLTAFLHMVMALNYTFPPAVFAVGSRHNSYVRDQ